MDLKYARGILTGGLPGDINGDGSTNSEDAIIGLKVVSGIDTSSEIRSNYSESGADVDGDDRIGLSEVEYILQYEAGFR